MSQVYLVTGANVGLGLDSVRRLAEMPTTKTVYMGCRSKTKAHDAIRLLQKSTSDIDPDKLKYIHFDASKPQDEIVKIANFFHDKELNGLILNAGGIGHDTSKEPIGPNSVLEVYQINLIGHIQLVEILKPKLAEGCKIVVSGSEAARGVPMMMLSSPKMGTTPEWFQEQLEGKDKTTDPMVNYAKAKGFAAFYFAEWARRNPTFKVWVVSPGGIAGTNVLSAGAVPSHLKFMMPLMMPILKFVGVMHSLEDGSGRYIQILTGNHPYTSGAFVASKQGTTGGMVDQTTLQNGKKYADPIMQKAAFEALSKYISI
eukprot:scaffold5771_cov171-Amphora_coffeaeformis.AAC.30